MQPITIIKGIFSNGVTGLREGTCQRLIFGEQQLCIEGAVVDEPVNHVKARFWLVVRKNVTSISDDDLRIRLFINVI